jgi:hypothetical protein
MKPTLEKFQPLIQRLNSGVSLSTEDRLACVAALEIAASVKDLQLVERAEIGTLTIDLLSKD